MLREASMVNNDVYGTVNTVVTPGLLQKNVKKVYQFGGFSGFNSVFSRIFSKICQKIAKCNSPRVTVRESLLYYNCNCNKLNLL